MKENNLLTVGYHKGEMDFGINCSIDELTYEEMKNFREMVCVAIGQAEQMWRRKSSGRQPYEGRKELLAPPPNKQTN